METGTTCNASFAADSAQELLDEVKQHLKDKHRVTVFSRSLQNYVLEVARRG